MSRALAAALVVFALALPAHGAAQRSTARWTAHHPGSATGLDSLPSIRTPSWLRPLASLGVPGTGQFLAGQDRGVMYIAVETLLLVRFFGFQAEGRREGNQFRDLAFTVARAGFSPSERDTAFTYFEQLSKFVESGPFDLDPGPAFLPPEDPSSYNGSLWILARQTFFADPDSLPDQDSDEYQRAVAFYRQRAVGPNFRWSWRNAGLEQDLFRRTIEKSDEGYRQATQQLGFLLVNHLISAVDAVISNRLSRNGRRVRLGTAVWPGHGEAPVGWRAVVQIGF